ncbi:MAG: dihydrofolate reductase [Elusimicrobia bacterium]|nr:dihydrofolate reductase [Elusimicrobiota bacterium]
MISLVVAMARNRVIGAAGKLPWHLPEDLKRFKAVTTGHPIVMGRKTFDSIGRPLPGRTNVVVTRDASRVFPGCVVASSLDDALAKASAPGVPGSEEVCVIGGGEIYRQALPRAGRIYLTRIDREVAGDAFFPEFDEAAFEVVSREARTEPFPFEFLVLRRR